MELRDASLARPALSYETVNDWYTDRNPRHAMVAKIVSLCESHERLRAELSGAEDVIRKLEAESAANRLLIMAIVKKQPDESILLYDSDLKAIKADDVLHSNTTPDKRFTTLWIES